MRVLLLLGLILLASCGVKKSSFKLGQTTRQEVVAMKGEPLREEAIPVKDSTVLVYPDEEKLQFKNDVLVNSFKNPEGDEKQLIYWKHKFKECQLVSKALPQEPAAHTPPEIEMSCPSEGVSIIYSQGSDIVTRVVEYEAK
jgi:hypothetical protein